MTNLDLGDGCYLAPEQIRWAAHVRWAIENDHLYVLDLRRSTYLSLPLTKLMRDRNVILDQLQRRDLIGPDATRVDAVRPEMRNGAAGFAAFWSSALWARKIMMRHDLEAASRLLSNADAGADPRAREIIARYQNWRPLYPRPALCLFDSLALGRYLWSAGVRANLIYAVRGGPFSAHAWLEIGNEILNDDPEYCAGFVRMRSS